MNPHRVTTTTTTTSTTLTWCISVVPVHRRRWVNVPEVLHFVNLNLRYTLFFFSTIFFNTTATFFLLLPLLFLFLLILFLFTLFLQRDHLNVPFQFLVQIRYQFFHLHCAIYRHQVFPSLYFNRFNTFDLENNLSNFLNATVTVQSDLQHHRALFRSFFFGFLICRFLLFCFFLFHLFLRWFTGGSGIFLRLRRNNFYLLPSLVR
ncbi:hypothetical protein V8G54_020367 [Vigna mungo]|uniref:Uncharacterized protein n=1 Tax=Vigna mungo TaxID=3915 RepID=A0AAQ3RWM3_VIGMU